MTAQPSADSARLSSIDVARAVAIVMMLQGHFVALSLLPQFRDLRDPFYAGHAFLRGLTAPLFLTVSGLVFVYFVLSSGEPLSLAHPRVRRGLSRGLWLLALGYLLRVDLLNLVQPGPGVFARLGPIHVLHLVGVGLWLLTACALVLSRLGAAVLGGFLGLLGFGFFLGTGLMRGADLDGWPVGLASYLVEEHGSVFPLFPWLGYVCLGGACGVWVGRSRVVLPVSLLLLAVGLHLRATPWMFGLHRACGEGALCDTLVPVHVYLHRASVVLGLLAVLLLLEPWLARHAPHWLRRTGRQTLFVFAVHAIVLYGSLTGFGIGQTLRGTLTPAVAIPAAVVFVALHVWLVQVWDQRRSLRSGVTRRWRTPPCTSPASAAGPGRSGRLRRHRARIRR